LQVAKAVETFILREGRAPDARWYVVNQSYLTPPSQRQPPLRGSPDVESFAVMGGLVIDTRDLFRLREAVRARELTAEAARESLRSTKGVYSYTRPEATDQRNDSATSR
jgi:hypothetical protein